jgi:APA family basic amino acid/polyamine antiporter
VVIATIIYIAVALVVTGMVPYQDISVDAPISNVFHKINMKVLS